MGDVRARISLGLILRLHLLAPSHWAGLLLPRHIYGIIQEDPKTI